MPARAPRGLAESASRTPPNATAPLRLSAEKQKGKIFYILFLRAPDKIFSIKERKFSLFAFLLTQKRAAAFFPLLL